MLKLYTSAINPGYWVASGTDTGWVIFPAVSGGWENRRQARGLDPMHLREVPVQLASNTGFPQVTPPRYQEAA
jgi:hypothetical protein